VGVLLALLTTTDMASAQTYRETLTPHPTPLPRKSGLTDWRTFNYATPGRGGEGADRASLQSVTLTEEPDLSKL